MLLSVLTPTLNCARTLADTIDSVSALHQEFPGQIQHLIGDAGSTDGTAKIIARHVARNEWASSYHLPSLNIPATLNSLLASCQGRWVAVLNGDDEFEVANMAAVLRDTPIGPPSIICGQVAVLSEHGDFLGSRDCIPDKLDSFMSVNHPSMLVDRRAFEVVGSFDPGTPVAYDYAWTWLAHRSGIPFLRHPVILATARLGGISQTRANQSAREILRFKIAAGSIYRAIGNHLVFQAKSWIRRLLPAGAANALVRKYRGLKGTIEHY